LIDTGVELWTIYRVIEAKDLREQNDAIQVNAAQIGRENGGARRAVALTKQVFRRIPSAVFGEEAADEALESVAIAINAVEGLGLVLAKSAAEAGSRRINEDKVADVKERILVIDDAVGRGFLVIGIRNNDAPRREGAEVAGASAGLAGGLMPESGRILPSRPMVESSGSVAPTVRVPATAL
jgi:hypothetical protein